MSNNQVNPALNVPLAPPTKVSGGMCPVPANSYLCRFISAAEHLKEAEGGKPAKLSIKVTGEIISPDNVTGDDGKQYNVAQRKFDIYLSIDPAGAGFPNTYEFASRMSLLAADGTLIPAELMQQLKSGMVFAVVNLMSEPEYIRRSPKPGQRVGDVVLFNGQPQIRGHRINLVSPEQVLQRVAPPEGFQAPKF